VHISPNLASVDLDLVQKVPRHFVHPRECTVQLTDLSLCRPVLLWAQQVRRVANSSLPMPVPLEADSLYSPGNSASGTIALRSRAAMCR
jgi:hypothetical protein